MPKMDGFELIVHLLNIRKPVCSHDLYGLRIRGKSLGEFEGRGKSIPAQTLQFDYYIGCVTGKTLKELYTLDVLTRWHGAFPNLVSYTRFVELMPWCKMAVMLLFTYANRRNY
jgi:hypothetical protein